MRLSAGFPVRLGVIRTALAGAISIGPQPCRAPERLGRPARSLSWVFAVVVTTPVAAAAGDPVTVANVTELKALAGLVAGAEVRLEGYRQPGDGGGGTFRYDPAGRQPPDEGAIFDLQSAPGRLIRSVGGDDEPLAEWFGAHGDGAGPDPHDDQQPINRCLAAYGRVRLLAKTYGVRGKPAAFDPAVSHHAVDLGPFFRIVGSGRGRTTLRLLSGSNPRGAGTGDNVFTLVANRDFHESAEHVVVSDLTIDCNFDGQDGRSTIQAIGIRGGGALVERVDLRGYGTGLLPESGSSRECFVVHQRLVFKDAASCRRAAVLRDLDFTGCGRNGKLEGRVAEITHVALGGANNFEDADWILPQGHDPAFDPADGGENERNWWPAYGGLVEGCFIHDEAFDPDSQKSPLNGITIADCIGAVVRGNRVEAFEGTGVFVMSWWHRDTVIVGNRFRDVTTGVALNLAGEGGRPVQCPRHEHLLVADNEILLGAHRRAPWGTCGISIYGGDIPAGVRLRSVHVLRNRISGPAFTDARGETVLPAGIRVHVLRPNYSDLRVEENMIDVPAAPGRAATGLCFFPEALWAEAVREAWLVSRGNRDAAGRILDWSLIGW